MPELDIEFIRSQFPALSTEALHGQAFFENAGGSYTSKYVIDRLVRFYTERKVQPYYPSKASTLGGEEMDEARDRLAAIMNVKSNEICFGPSTTQNVYVLAQAFREYLSSGDAIIVTDQDHEANSGAWRRLEGKGVEVREWSVDPETGFLKIKDLENLLDSKVKLVCFPHCSNIVGQINPVKQICDLVHKSGAIACVDGVSFAPHGLPDIKVLGADIYMFSSYKTYGPHQGIMYINSDLGNRLPNQAHYFNANVLYKRFTPAGPDHAQVAACAGMADYLDAVYEHHFSEGASPDVKGRAVAKLQSDYETHLMEPLLESLRSRNDVRIIGPDTIEARVPTISLALNRSPADVTRELVSKGIMAGFGDFYALRLMQAMKLDPKAGVLRLSFVHYTSHDEIEKLINAIDDVL